MLQLAIENLETSCNDTDPQSHEQGSVDQQNRVAAALGQADPDGGMDHAARERRIKEACERLAYLLNRVAGRFARRLPAHVELDDLMGAGAVGLVTAVRQHVEKPEPDIARLAEQRIRGAILDYLRSVDHLTRRQRAAVSAVNRAKQKLANLGEESDTTNVASELGITHERAEQIQNRLAVVQLTSIEDSEQLPGHGLDPAQETMHRQMKDQLVGALDELPERLQTLLSLYYCENLTYKEIGNLLGISRSRICQLHSQAIAELRTRLASLAA